MIFVVWHPLPDKYFEYLQKLRKNRIESLVPVLAKNIGLNFAIFKHFPTPFFKLSKARKN